MHKVGTWINTSLYVHLANKQFVTLSRDSLHPWLFNIFELENVSVFELLC
jgi:hypothetical protein